MRGRQNYGLFFGPLDTRCRIIIGARTGTIIVTATHIVFGLNGNITGVQKPKKQKCMPLHSLVLLGTPTW